MGSDDRRLRDIKRIAHRFVRYVRHVYEHAQAVHLAHDLFAKIAQTVVLLLATTRVGPVVCVVPRQCHVANAKTIKLPQRRERVLDRVTAFNTHQRSNLSLLLSAANVRGGSGKD